jgi:hypothetical protein
MAAAGRERRPQRGAGDRLDRRVGEHEHRALGRRRGDRDHARARRRERRRRLVAVCDRDELLGHAGAHQQRPHALAGQRRPGDEHDAVPGQQPGGDLQGRLGPRRARAAEHADDAARLLHTDGAPPRAEQRRPPEPAVGERLRTFVGELAEARDGRQQLAQHRLGPRAPGLAGQQERQVVELVEQDPRRTPQVAGARGRRNGGPQRLRRRRGCRGLVHHRRGGGLDRAQRLPGRGRARDQRHGAGR